MGIKRDQTDLVEEIRLPAGGSFVITDEQGKELFRVTAEGDAVKVAGETIEDIVADAVEDGGSGAPAGFTFTEDDANFSNAPSISPADATADALTIWTGDLLGTGNPYAKVAVYPGSEPTAELFVSQDTSNAQVYLDSNDGSIQLLSTGQLFVGPNMVIFDLSSLPTTDPGAAGQLYTNGAPGLDDPKPLMVSGGTAP